jgi:hypothetical protein
MKDSSTEDLRDRNVWIVNIDNIQSAPNLLRLEGLSWSEFQGHVFLGPGETLLKILRLNDELNFFESAVFIWK